MRQRTLCGGEKNLDRNLRKKSSTRRGKLREEERWENPQEEKDKIERGQRREPQHRGSKANISLLFI